MYDFHLHSDFSMDAKSSIDSMCISAIEKNLKGICFTDHIDLDVTKNKLDFHFRTQDYLRDLKSAKYRYDGKLQVFSGLEIGMQSHLVENYDEIIQNGIFDFVIMSIHCLGENSEFIDEFLNSADTIIALELYYKTMYECVKVFDNYDVLGHIDFVDRYFIDKTHIPKYERVFPIIEKILKLIIEKGKGIEVNTASLRYGLDYLHPKLSILKLYKELGGEIITIGSDAHSPEFVGDNLDLAEKLVKSLGFKNIYIFKDRKKIPIKL